MADKQPPPSAANYDPSVPAPEQGPHRGRGWWCWCLFRIFWILFVCAIVLVVVVILVTYIIIQPYPFKFLVSEAKLTEFNYAESSNSLRYNLVLNFTARNPNKKLSIYYDRVEGDVVYDGVRVASGEVVTWMGSFRQYAKSTDHMNGSFAGQQVAVLDASNFERDKRKGVFHIDVRLYFKIRFRLGDFIAGDMKPRAQCGLRVPLGSNQTAATGFRSTQCDVDF